MNPQKGFSVGELLVAFFLVFFLGVFALTYFLSSRRGGCGGCGSSAAATVRTLSMAQATYTSNFPNAGFEPNLATLGGGPGCEQGSPAHACIIDNVLGCPEGVGQKWCTKDWYRYNIQSSSRSAPYKDFWVTATLDEKSLEAARSWTDRFLLRPAQKSPSMNYCALPDGSVRVQEGPSLKRPYTKSECEGSPPY